jgi:hypothetical protein
MSDPQSPAAPADRLRDQVQANLEEARALLDREQRRLAELLAALPPPPAIPDPVTPSIAGGLAAIERTMRATMDCLSRQTAPAPRSPVLPIAGEARAS